MTLKPDYDDISGLCIAVGERLQRQRVLPIVTKLPALTAMSKVLHSHGNVGSTTPLATEVMDEFHPNHIVIEGPLRTANAGSYSRHVVEMPKGSNTIILSADSHEGMKKFYKGTDRQLADAIIALEFGVKPEAGLARNQLKDILRSPETHPYRLADDMKTKTMLAVLTVLAAEKSVSRQTTAVADQLLGQSEEDTRYLVALAAHRSANILVAHATKSPIREILSDITFNMTLEELRYTPVKLAKVRRQATAEHET